MVARISRSASMPARSAAMARAFALNDGSRRRRSTAVRIAFRSGVLVPRSRPTPDHAMRAQTSDLSSVVPPATTGTPVCKAWDRVP